MKVIGGSNATQGEFPYQILIKIAQPSNPEQVPFCGGTLVVVNNTQVVLSSATCVSGEDIEGLSLVAGELNPYVESGWEQYRNVSDCTFYGFYLDDIAVIIPETPFELNEQVKPARLPSTPYMPSEGEVIITGWGDLKPYNWDDPQVPKPAEILQKIKMKLLSEEECIEQLFPIFDVQPYHLCTALVNGTATDPCWGDLGGPVYSIEGDYLAGIVGVGVRKSLVSKHLLLNLKFLQ